MSGAILNLVYGVPLSERAREQIKEWAKQGKEFEDPRFDICTGSSLEEAVEGFGFEELYSAHGEDAYFVGELIVSFWEGENFKLDSLGEYKPKHKEEIKKEINKLPKELREMLEPIDYYLIWSNS